MIGTIIPERYEILLILAPHKPVEKVITKDVGPDGDIQY